jgi:hypothetical protein
MFECNHAASPVEANLKLEKCGEEEKVDATLFKQIVGSLRYLCNIRPDIGFSVGLVSRYMDDPRISHMKAARRILRYLNGTINYGIFFPSSTDDNDALITCYSDSDWYGDKSDRRSTTCSFFKVFGAPISWCSRKQSVVAFSSCEAEYIVGSYVHAKLFGLNLC